MVFSWVWKNMLGGDEELGDNTVNRIVRDGNAAVESGVSVNGEENLNAVRNGTAQNATSTGELITSGVTHNHKKSNAQETAPGDDSNKSNGGAPVNDTSRGRKNKLVAPELGSSKKMRLPVSNDIGKIAKAVTTPTSQLSPSTSRVSYPFDEMYARLVAFKQEKGHCRVPQNHKDDKKLASWVKNVRRNQKPGKVVDEAQIQQLNEIGFQWESKAGRPIGATIEAGAKMPARKFRKPIDQDED
jgi:Helicase associated domain